MKALQKDSTALWVKSNLLSKANKTQCDPASSNLSSHISRHFHPASGSTKLLAISGLQVNLPLSLSVDTTTLL